jgi:hypothetical protein
MRSFSALDHLRRCRTEVTISACVFVIGSPPYPLSEPFDNWGELITGAELERLRLNVSIDFEALTPCPLL